MGKLIVQQNTRAMCPLILRQMAKSKNKKDKCKDKNVRCYTSIKLNRVDPKQPPRNPSKRKIVHDDEPKAKKVKVDDSTSRVDEPEPLGFQSTNLADLEEIVYKTSDADDIIITGTISEKQSLNWSEQVDLFWTDEIKSSYEPLKRVNMSYQVVDEICLEGLDGITLEALWTRLLHSFQLPLLIPNMAKELLWQLICCMDFIEFYILEEPRKPLHIQDRYKYMDKSCGVIVEPSNSEIDIYPFRPIVDKDIRGSCSTYYGREPPEEEVRKMSYKDVIAKYGSRLVIVANQEMRQHALYYEMADPQVEIVDIAYFILERVGRSRRHGEITQGYQSLQNMCLKDSRAHYHNRKQLVKNKLITKQFFYTTSTQWVTRTGGLVHLNRFYNKRKSKQLLVTEEIYNAIKQKPYHRMDAIEFRKRFGYSSSLARLMKSQEFLKFIKTDGTCLYRELYPDASRSEWKFKSKNVEKSLRVLQIIDPTVNIEANWYNAQSSDDEDSTDEEYVSKETTSPHYLHELYSFIYSKGKQGVTVKELRKYYEIDFYTIRLALRKMVLRNVVFADRVDMGRQRVGRYTAICFHSHLEPVNVAPKEYKLKQSILDKVKKKQEHAVSKQHIKVEECPVIMPPKPVNSEHLESVLDSSHVKCICLEATPQSLVEQISSDKIETFCNYEWCNIIVPLPRINLKCEAIDSLPNMKLNLQTYSDIKVSPTIFLADSVDIYVQNRRNDSLMSVLLIKRLLNELATDRTLEDLLCVLKNNLDAVENDDVNQDSMIVDKVATSTKIVKTEVTNNTVDELLGSDCVVVFEEVSEHDILTQIWTSGQVVDAMPPGSRFVDTQNRGLTERVLKRANMILDIINTEKVFEAYRKLLKIIANKEFETGYKKLIDKRSLKRILDMLKNEGYIKIYKLLMRHKGEERVQHFLCLPNITHDHSVITVSREQLKMRFFVSAATVSKKDRQKIEVVPPKKDSIKVSCQEYNTMIVSKRPPPYKFDSRHAKIYGYKPKFLRMQILHEFMFYLVYEYHDHPTFTDQDTLKVLRSYQLDSNLGVGVMAHLPKLYNKEVGWKMFVPPLPKHKGWEVGWTLVCDLLLRLPLSVFVNLHGIPYIVPELQTYLNHPIKRHFLVRHLPATLRNVLLYNRKHMYSLHMSLTRLCYIGLVQFGPQKYREKDQVFVYVNRRASLLDTTTSAPFYNMVSEKPYKKVEFCFDTKKAVENYWWNLWSISMSTPLGKRHAGEYIIIEDPSIKPQLIEVLKPREPQIVETLDTGYTPGDQKGAAGLDSSLWVHLKRNWLWSMHSTWCFGTQVATVGTDLRQGELNQIRPQAINFARLKDNDPKLKKIFLHKEKKPGGKVEAQQKKLMKRRDVGSIVKKKKVKQKKIVKKVQPYSNKKVVRQYHDSLDKAILRQNGARYRVSWSQHERLILKMIKAAFTYLTRHTKTRPLTFLILRDTLHALCPSSKDKTSRAVQRRLKTFQKSPKETRNIEYLTETISNMTACKKYFNKWRLPKESLSDKQIVVAFLYLMAYLHDNINYLSHTLPGMCSRVDHFAPDSINHYKPNLVYVEEPPSVIYQQPHSIEDIKLDIIRSVVHSSLSCHESKITWSYQVFRVYQKYSDIIIRKAILWLKRQQILSYRKTFSVKKKQLSHVPYQLSNLYIYMQASTFIPDTTIEAFKILETFSTSESSINNVFSLTMTDKRYGTMLGFNELASVLDTYELKFSVPDVALMLNPNMEDHSEVLQELAVRYQLRLQEKIEDDDINEEQNMFNEEVEETETSAATEIRSKEAQDIKMGENTESVPSIDEIIAGMLDSSTSKSRRVPHFSDLQQLLSREKFPHLRMDDVKLERLKSHFITCVPYLEEFNLTNREDFKNNYVVDYIINKKSNNMLKTAINQYIIGEPMFDNLEEMIRNLGGNETDLKLAKEIISFVLEKQYLGASGAEIKEKFSSRSNMALHILVNILTKSKILLKCGVTSLVFVSYKFKSPWLVETFFLSEAEKHELQALSKAEQEGLNEEISKRITLHDEIHVQVAPWTKVDGSFNEPLLHKWLATVLSYCMEHPTIQVKTLFLRFCYLKPVDVFQLLEFLEEAGAVEMFTYQTSTETDLFNEIAFVHKQPATCLDNFNDMVVMVHNLSTLCLGSAIAAVNL